MNVFNAELEPLDKMMILLVEHNPDGPEDVRFGLWRSWVLSPPRLVSKAFIFMFKHRECSAYAILSNAIEISLTFSVEGYV